MVNSGLAFCFWLFAAVVAVVFFWKRWRWRRNNSRGKPHLGYYPNAAVLGNALQILQSLAEPQTEYTLAEKLDERAEDDDSGGPDDPTAHLLRQAKQIREGNPPKRITARLPPRT